MKRSAAEILREYGPFPGIDRVNGVTFDGQHVWFASGDKLNAFDPASGKTVRSIDVAAHAGTAFDGEHLFQIAEDQIQKIDPKTGRVLATIPAPGGGGHSGLAGGEGTVLGGEARDATGSRRVRARVRWRPSVLLRRRKQREGEIRPPTQARLRVRQRLL